ncbi:MAG: EscU/YscU/HrcU family type III secretion system export apparatus switch protein, partial [Giesbergeria sp.]|nr:EscU/YscU/HrcU family type III secretion system export apparatus switch protein [Giesbergeria sp.]
MESSQDRNLPATERKLQKARTDGQGARSRDLSHLAILGTGAASMLVFAQPLFDQMLRAMGQQLVFDATTVHTPAYMLTRLQGMAFIGILASAAFATLTGAAALVSAIGAGGWIFSLKPITPQFNRLNPISGAANLFSKQQMANV